jgi:peptide/nickel transport system permease protein
VTTADPSRSPSFLEEPPTPQRTRAAEFWRLLRRNRMALAGMLIFALFFASAMVGLALTSGSRPLLNPAMVRLQEKLRPPMSAPHLESLRPEEHPPLGVYLFGTDDLGRDVFARMLQGAWVSLTVGFVAVGISVVIGIVMGGLAGYYGQRRIRLEQLLLTVVLLTGAGLLAAGRRSWGVLLLVAGHAWLFWSISPWGLQSRRTLPPGLGVLRKSTLMVDTVIMRFVDIMLCFPSFFLILTVVALLPASIYNIMIVIGLTSWEGTARFVRAEFLSLREQDFVAAARALGVANLRIIFRHMVPNAVAPVLVSATIGIASAILTEAGLSFLGFGVPPPHATWGNILSDGKRFIFDAPWLTFIPGAAILIVVLAFNLCGEGLRDILNPRLRERH